MRASQVASFQRSMIVAGVMAAVGVGWLASVPARADSSDIPEREARAAIAHDPDNAIRALKAGEVAQQRRWQGQLDELDPHTRATVNGETPQAQTLRERGNAARQVRQDHARRQMFDEMLERDGRPTGGRQDVERLGHHPDDLDRLQRAGDSARAARGYPERSVTDLAEGRAVEAAELRQRGEIAQRARGANTTAHGHANIDASSRSPRPGRVGGIARGVAGGVAVGWAADTALGMHVPDPVDALKWSTDTLARPEQAPQRVGELANGAVRFTGDVAKSLSRPDRMAVRMVNGAADVVNTGGYMVTHPAEGARMVGDTVVGVGKTAVDLGKGVGRAAVGVAKATRPDRVVGSVGCGIGKVFAPKKKC